MNLEPIRLCGTCYAEEPCQRMEWQFKQTVGCSHHQLRLLSECPNYSSRLRCGKWCWKSWQGMNQRFYKMAIAQALLLFSSHLRSGNRSHIKAGFFRRLASRQSSKLNASSSRKLPAVILCPAYHLRYRIFSIALFLNLSVYFIVSIQADLISRYGASYC